MHSLNSKLLTQLQQITNGGRISLLKQDDKVKPDLTVEVHSCCPFASVYQVHDEEDILRCKMNTLPSAVLCWKSEGDTYSSSYEESQKTFSKSRRKVSKYTNKAIQNTDFKQKHKLEIFVILYNHMLCNLKISFWLFFGDTAIYQQI